MTENPDTPAYLEELASTLASHGSNLAALRMAELEQKVAPSLAPPGVPSATAGSGGSLAGLATAYSTSVAMGAAGLFITDGAITVKNPAGTVIIDGSSKLFKIVASGVIQTAAFTNPANPGSTVTVTLSTGLTVVPSYQAYMQYMAIAGCRLVGQYSLFANNGAAIDWFECWVQLAGGNQTVVYAQTSSARPSGTTVARNYSYFILGEAAF